MQHHYEFNPDPPSYSREAEELAAQIYVVRSDLTNAAEGVEAAYYGSCALYGLHTHALAERPTRISLAESELLLRALALAVPQLMKLFSNGHSGHAAVGCRAAARMISYWAAANEERTGVGQDRRADMIARVRWLRNELHNYSILTEIEARAAKRRQRIISSVKQQVLRKETLR